MFHNLEVVSLMKSQQLHALDQIRAADPWIEDPEMPGDTFDYPTESVLHFLGLGFELLPELMQCRQSIRPARNEERSSSHPHTGGLALRKDVDYVSFERAIAEEPCHWEKDWPGYLYQEAVDPHGPTQVQKSISSGPISVARPSPHHGGRHTMEDWKKGLALCMHSTNPRSKGW